ncbi:MAG: hypothetical protein JJU12_03305 [Chlamydiales bacterium]|nr:hypothetical protein [Chlamydiales bacterium]
MVQPTISKAEGIQLTPNQSEGRKKIERLEMAIRITGIACLALFALTIVFLGLAQADYIHPVAALISFSAIIPLIAVIKALDTCQLSVAKKHKIDLETLHKVISRQFCLFCSS